jgi:hypothetical protein
MPALLFAEQLAKSWHHRTRIAVRNPFKELAIRMDSGSCVDGQVRRGRVYGKPCRTIPLALDSVALKTVLLVEGLAGSGRGEV